MSLPACGFHELLQARTAGAPEEFQNVSGFAPGAGAGFLLGRLCRRGALVRFLRRGGPLARLGLGRRDVGRVCGDTRLFRLLCLLGGDGSRGVVSFGWNAVHIWLSPWAVITAITSITRIIRICKRILLRRVRTAWEANLAF